MGVGCEYGVDEFSECSQDQRGTRKKISTLIRVDISLWCKKNCYKISAIVCYNKYSVLICENIPMICT